MRLLAHDDELLVAPTPPPPIDAFIIDLLLLFIAPAALSVAASLWEFFDDAIDEPDALFMLIATDDDCRASRLLGDSNFFAASMPAPDDCVVFASIFVSRLLSVCDIVV